MDLMDERCVPAVESSTFNGDGARIRDPRKHGLASTTDAFWAPSRG